jgi:hypothetical protein
MNKLCNFIDNNINLDYDISYYIKQSNEDLIGFNIYDNYDTVDYVINKLNSYFYKKDYDIIFFYHNKKIMFFYNNSKCIITSNNMYWILEIKNIFY